jgi:hypothetical protein
MALVNLTILECMVTLAPFFAVSPYYSALPLESRNRQSIYAQPLYLISGANFWLKMFNDLKNREVADVLIAVVDGFRVFTEVIEATSPKCARSQNASPHRWG